MLPNPNTNKRKSRNRGHRGKKPQSVAGSEPGPSEPGPSNQFGNSPSTGLSTSPAMSSQVSDILNLDWSDTRESDQPSILLRSKWSNSASHQEPPSDSDAGSVPPQTLQKPLRPTYAQVARVQASPTSTVNKINAMVDSWFIIPEPLNPWADDPFPAIKGWCTDLEFSDPSTRHQVIYDDWNPNPNSIEQKMISWPWPSTDPRAKLLAPLSRTLQPWSLPRVDNTNISPLFRLLRIDPIRSAIMSQVLRNPQDVKTFSLLCQDALELAVRQVDIWDITHGHFHYCEVPRLAHWQMMEDPGFARFPQGSVKAELIITPVRDDQGLPKYATQAKSLYNMCISFNNFTENIKNVQFHRVPLLTTHILQLIIPKLPKLQSIGVYSCPLIHIGSTLKLFDILRQQNEHAIAYHEFRHKYVKTKSCIVKWEFFPMFHIGPKKNPDGRPGTGYGCTWDNTNMDSRQQIWNTVWALVYTAKRLKVPNGLSVLAEGSAFRRWLKLSPCLRVDQTLERIMDPKCSPEEMAAWIRFDKFEGRVDSLTKHLVFPRESKWPSKTKNCSTCKVDVPIIFYHWHVVAGLEVDSIECAACMLEFILQKEQDHYKNKKRNIIGKWLEKGRDENGKWHFEQHDLQLVINNFTVRDIVGKARDLDNLRQYDILDAAQGGAGYDRELNERQAPLPAHVYKRKVGSRWCSPSIHQDERYACDRSLNHHGVRW